ncbi:MAG: hypothetical protein HRU14_18035, partial [Planctomycetes bacterium]|nr:hypothetical protein [Planctomycetota bacterium]
ARGDHVIRLADEGEKVLRELPGRPTGRIRQFEPDPHGGTFVAAEHGIFLVHPSVDTIDRIDLGDGAPKGSPVGIVLDDERRLWIATDRAFGVVNTGFFYGRSGDYPELPGPPYTGLRLHPEGGLEVLTAAGGFRYVPDQGLPPRINGVTVDGNEWSGKALARTWPIAVDVNTSATGAGEATLRWVTDGHHNWLPLPGRGLTIAGLNPGDRTVELVALDRDLRRSTPVVIELRCAYPWWLRPAVLLGGSGAFAVLVLGGFLMLARRSGGGRANYGRALVSTFILTWLVLQLVAGLFPHARGWPFCGFSMYTEKSRENDIGGPVSMAIATRDGKERSADLRRFKLVFDTRWQVIRPFLNGDPAYRRHLLDLYNQLPGGVNARALRVVQYRTRLTRNGKVPVAPLVMGAVEAPR